MSGEKRIRQHYMSSLNLPSNSISARQSVDTECETSRIEARINNFVMLFVPGSDSPESPFAWKRQKIASHWEQIEREMPELMATANVASQKYEAGLRQKFNAHAKLLWNRKYDEAESYADKELRSPEANELKRQRLRLLQYLMS